MGNGEREISSGQEDKSTGRKPKFLIIAVMLLGLFGIVFITRLVVFRIMNVSTDNAQVDADIIPVSSKVAGRIHAINFAEGDRVTRGQVIAEIEDSDYRLALDIANARLEAMKLDLEKAQSALALTKARTSAGVLQSSKNLAQVKGQVSISSTKREVNLVKLQNDLERAEVNLKRMKDSLAEAGTLATQAGADLGQAKTLFESGVVSREKYELANTAASVADSRLEQAEQGKLDAEKSVDLAKNNLKMAGVDVEQSGISERDRDKAGYALNLSMDQRTEEVRMAEATVKGLEAQVKALEAIAEQAATSLGETKVLCPVDGIIARKISQPGEIIPTGKPILFVLDTSSIWVTANIEETNIEDVHQGAKATVTVDALSGQTFNGMVMTIGAAANAKFSLIPQSNPTGQFIKVTQRIPVKISLDGNLDKIKPGMNAVVTIKRKQD